MTTELQGTRAERAKQFATALWASQSTNRKTGNVPTLWVGSTREETEASCSGCPVRDECYYHNGTGGMAHASLRRSAAKRPERYTAEHALRTRSASARYVRASGGGDPSACDPVQLRADFAAAREAGLGVLAYTHFPDRAAKAGMVDLFCASVGATDDLQTGLEEVDHALWLGFKRAAMVAPWDAYDNGPNFTTPEGARGRICPALLAHSKGRRVTCDQCGLCDPEKPGPAFIVFPDHGPRMRGKLRAAAKAGKTWAINLLNKL